MTALDISTPHDAPWRAAYDKAGIDAYKKAIQEVRKDLVPALMSAIQK